MVTVLRPLFDWLNGSVRTCSGELIDILLDVPPVLQVRKLPVPPDTLLLNDVISCVVVNSEACATGSGWVNTQMSLCLHILSIRVVQLVLVRCTPGVPKPPLASLLTLKNY
jgi:hypothetical protein